MALSMGWHNGWRILVVVLLFPRVCLFQNSTTDTYVLSSLGASTCDNGGSQATKEQCDTLAYQYDTHGLEYNIDGREYNTTFVYIPDGNWSDFPYGCGLSHEYPEFQELAFNSDPSGAGQYQTKLICMLTSPPTGVVVGDPVAHYNGARTKFWLPTHTIMPLLVAPDLMVFGSTFAGQRGGGEEQRFERFVIVGVEHQILQVSVNHASIASSDGSSSCQTGLAPTIDVSLSIAANMPRTEYFEKSMDEYDHGSLRFQVVCFEVSGSTIPAEVVQISTASQRLFIYSSAAEEYVDEAMSVQIKHVHLNFHMLEMRDTERMAGILPELWGLLPLSDCVASMTKYPVALLDSECAMSGLLWKESAQTSLTL